RTDGDLELQHIAAGRLKAFLPTEGWSLTVTSALIKDAIDLVAANIRVDDLQHVGVQPLRASIVGPSGTASSVILRGASPVGVVFDLLEADQADIIIDADDVHFLDTLIGSSARFGNSYHIVIADNVERKLFDADLQI